MYNSHKIAGLFGIRDAEALYDQVVELSIPPRSPGEQAPIDPGWKDMVATASANMDESSTADPSLVIRWRCN